MPPLLFLPVRVQGEVDGTAAERTVGKLLLSCQARQQIADGSAQQVGELCAGGAGGRGMNQSDEGPGQGALLGEANGAVEPQAVGVEAGCLAQGVVGGVVVEAGEVAVLLQGAENGHGRNAQGVAELLEGGNGPVLEEVEDSGLEGGQWHLVE